MSSCIKTGICSADPRVIHLSSGMINFLELLTILIFIAILGYIIYTRHYKTLRNMGISFIAILLFEIMIDPVIINHNYSSWTYLFHDITLILTIGWVILVSATISLVDFTFKHLSDFKRFWYYLVVIDTFALIFEIALTKLDMRSYSTSLIESSYGSYLPFTYIPIGVIIAIPVMFALVIAFTKYWESLLDKNE